MKTYSGVRTPGGQWFVFVTDGLSMPRELNPRTDLLNYSKAWGYSGSCQSQLAIAILADCMSEIVALEYHKEFCERVIAGLIGDAMLKEKAFWDISERDARAHVFKIAGKLQLVRAS